MIDLVIGHIVPAAYRVLPEEMESPQATAMLLSIGLQESHFEHRRQVHGPARGFWQFEAAGVWGVLEHERTNAIIRAALRALRYAADLPAETILEAIEHNDVLAAVIARCLLWTDPRALPMPDQAPQAWLIYLSCWRPGKPRVQTWQENYRAAWLRVQQPFGLRA